MDTLATGDLAPLTAPVVPAGVPHSRPAPRIAGPDTPGVLAGTGLGAYRPLPNLGEKYKILAWSPDGTHLLFSGGKSSTAWYVDVNTEQRWKLPAALNNLSPLVWSSDSRYVVLSDTPGDSTLLITLDTATGAILRTRYVGGTPKAAAAVKDLPIPYISQVWDTGVSYNGNWACGPTSVAMVLAFYGRLAPWPFSPDQTRLTADDRLRSRAAGAEPGKLDLMSGRLSGHKSQGLYGTIVGNTALADWDRMIDVLHLYNISSDYIQVSWPAITAQLDKGYPVILGTTLTTSGHILVARGYTGNGYLIVNDPYGNRFSGYGAPNGGDIAYPWKKIPAKLAMVTRGTITPPATPTPTAAPTATPSPSATTTPAVAAATARPIPTVIVPPTHPELSP